MLSLILLGGVLAGTCVQEDSAPTLDRAAYEAASRRAGENPAAHIRLALWCEAHGLAAERVRHLTLAISYDPANVLARGLAGQVSYRGKWGTAQEPEQTARNDAAQAALIREYIEHRAAAGHTADEQLKLAAWCA